MRRRAIAHQLYRALVNTDVLKAILTLSSQFSFQMARLQPIGDIGDIDKIGDIGEIGAVGDIGDIGEIGDVGEIGDI